ncbi:MAG TPA: Na-translocating system protein MpsC family protein [Solirubrobacterales bacterium]|nr:Na-translocating system protein MpsC family protein [Solirubrobacterales bacterium]
MNDDLSTTVQDGDAVESAGGAYDSIRAEISREMVRLYKELFGRGPTKARTEFAGSDIVICSLENSFTPAERSLVEMGEHQRLRDTRMYFQVAAADKFREIIERVTGRKVRAFISGLDAEQDVCSEVFYLENGQSPQG